MQMHPRQTDFVSIGLQSFGGHCQRNSYPKQEHAPLKELTASAELEKLQCLYFFNVYDFAVSRDCCFYQFRRAVTSGTLAANVVGSQPSR
jgi:hypothetical protein